MDGDYFISSPLIYNNIDNIYHSNLYTSECMCPIFLKQQLNKILNLHKQRPSEGQGIKHCLQLLAAVFE